MYDVMVCEKCMLKHPVEAGSVTFNYCPQCGTELRGYSTWGKIKSGDRGEAGDTR